MQSNRKIVLSHLGGGPLPSSDVNLELVPDQPQQSLDAQTPLQTETGVQRLDTLEVGTRILTRAGTFEPITQIDHTAFTNRQLRDMPDAAPIRFDPGALPDMPNGPATLVSPDCPIAWADDPSGLNRFPARAFCDGGLIRWVLPDEGIHYIRLHFATKQQISAGGIWIELDQEENPPSETTAHIPKLVHNIRIFRPLCD